jgi:hypothetical protein
LPIYASALQPGKTYKFQFKPTTSILQIPQASDQPDSGAQYILWKAAEGADTITFDVRSARPKMPNVILSLSAPKTYSLSMPFEFELTFKTDDPPFTVLAERGQIQCAFSDIEIIDAESAKYLGPERISMCRDDDDPEREDLLHLDGLYIEHRTLDFEHPMWGLSKLEVGRWYILRHLADSWWWSEDEVDEIMAYVKNPRGIGLPMAKRIEFLGPEDVHFKVVD